ncbi:hypothetical protein L0Z72_11500 [candidate division KSB1 bacterium]|nr:hypothetical protein [candidate division KSB1 bacterium]
MNSYKIFPELDRLKGEPAVITEIRTERGAPRLFVNGAETYPLLAWSWSLVQATPLFKKAGINILHPVLGLNSVRRESGEYDFQKFDEFFDQLLALHSTAFFLPRVQLDVPDWWKKSHPDEMIVPAIPIGSEGNERYHKAELNPEGGWYWGIHLSEPSMASEIWKSDLEKIFRAFLKHIEDSPLRSRIIGYQIASGIYGEWHYFMAEFLPDLSQPMRKKLDYIPDIEARLKTSFGLFRDPAKEKNVIEFYRRFHEEMIAETILHFARIVKQETRGRAICGTFYGYQLENVWIQEGGHLAPEKILNSPDIDFLASPYTYQSTNSENHDVMPHDIFDDAGNWLGRSRGIAGDGGYRILLESAKRHGKLYFAEIDPTTYIQFITQPQTKIENYESILAAVGGLGSDTIEGTKRILQRDLGQMFVNGNGGWLFDFGTLSAIRRSWYDDQPILEEVQKFLKLGVLRKELDLSSVAEIAAVYDAKSLFITRHWKAEAPYPKGSDCLDFFTHWFCDSQARTFHRIGAPLDFLYRFDLKPADAAKYRLFFMVNIFYLTENEVDNLRATFKNSDATVVWFYASGFVSPERLDLNQMERLTGFKFKIIEAPGPMMIRCHFDEIEITFGTEKERFPRFAVVDENARSLGLWADRDEVAFACGEIDGWNSVYVGAASLPVEILRWLAQKSGAKSWSTKPDIVRATQDAAMIVATENGERSFHLHKEMKDIESGKVAKEHHLNLEMGDVKIFVD